MRLLLLLLVVGCAHTVPIGRLANLDDSYTDSDARRATTDHACPRIERAHFWRVEKAGHTSYLLGTQHVGVGMDRLPDSVVKAFDAASIVAVETLDDDNSASPAEPKRPLSKELGRVAFARFVALIGKEYADDAEFLSPLAAMLILATMYVDTSNFLDSELEKTAHERNKRVVALETSEEVVPVIERWYGARLLRAVLMASRGRREVRDNAIESLHNYCTGQDPDTFADMKGGYGFSSADMRAMKHDLLDARNQAWIPRLEEILDEGNAFVAVGVAHLYGEGSVLDLLRARGYVVSRM